jgi:DHA2 family multidrug resistance protein
MVQTGEDDLVEYGFRRVIITITAVLCALFEIVDVTIVNVALNNMRGSLGASLTDVLGYNGLCHCKCDCDSYDELVVTTVGRRNYFAVSIIFTVASLCAVTLIIYGN